MTKLIINSKLILVIFAACMLCWRNILPSSQHFLSTSNIPKFSSITNFLLPISEYLIISKYQCFWQEAPLVKAYSPVALFSLLGYLYRAPSCYCGFFIQGSFLLLQVLYTRLLPVTAKVHHVTLITRVYQSLQFRLTSFIHYTR